VEEVLAVIEEQFGKPVNDLFQSFEEIPLGSASIGQVHAAVLKDGRPVVVKVQRPGVEETMRRDIMLLKKLVKPLKLAPSVGEAIDFHSLLEELWKVSQQELNYLIEATSTIKFRELNEYQPGITCPMIEESLTTSKVMTMEFIKGCSIGDNDKLDAAGYDRAELGSLMTQNYIKQVLDDGFFHADPHQGNIMVREDEIVWIDMGMVGSLTVQERNTIKQGIRAIVKKDNQAMIRALISLGATKGDMNYSKLYTDIDLLMDRYYTMDLGEMNMGTMLEDIIRAMNENNIVLPASVSMLARGLITIEGVLSRLSPETNIVQIAQTYVKRDMRKNHQFLKNVKQDAQNLVASTEKAMEIPGLASDLIKNTLRGQTKINLDLEGSKPLMEDFNRIMNNLIVCIITAALLVASSLICTTSMQPQILGIPALGFVGYVLAFMLGVYLIIKSHIKGK
jgi:ubiquinone biosynthesis protein